MLLNNKTDIEKWLKENHIFDYKLIDDEKYGYVVNVECNVDISFQLIKSIEVKFNIVKGSFNCCNNELKSLEGCPEIIEGSFNCSDNQLKSLEYCPKNIKGYFDCGYNKLISLKDVPKIIEGNFYCNNNKLKFEQLKILNALIVNGISIDLEDNEELGEWQKIDNFLELKKMLKIIEEKECFMNVVEKELKNNYNKTIKKI